MSILLAFNSCSDDEIENPSPLEENSINGHNQVLNKRNLTFEDFYKLNNTIEVKKIAEKISKINLSSKLNKSENYNISTENIIEIEYFNQKTYTFFVKNDEDGLLNFVIKETPEKTSYYFILYPSDFAPYKKDETNTKVKIKEISQSELAHINFDKSINSKSSSEMYGNFCVQIIACSSGWHDKNNISEWYKCQVSRPQMIIVDCDNDLPIGGGGGGTGSGGGPIGGDPSNPNPGNGQQPPTGVITDPNTGEDYTKLIIMLNEITVYLQNKITQSQQNYLYNNIPILTKINSSIKNAEYSQETYIWVINYLSHIDNISAADYFNQNPQDLDIIFYTDVDFNNIEDLDFINTSTNTIVDLLINNKNNTLSNLDYSWPNLDNLKQKVKNAISKGIYTTAKYTRDYLYIPMVKAGKKYPSTIYWSNKGIDKIRLEAVTPMVNFNENTMNWSDLFNIWLFELTPNKYANNIINFTNSSNIINGNNIYNPSTNAVKNFPKGNNTPGGNVLNIQSELANGLSVGQTKTGYFKYDVNAFYSTISNSNIGIQMLGSFPITAKIISISGRSAVVQFHIYNDLGWESGTRFIKGQNGGGNQGIIDDKPVGTGLHLGGTIRNNFTWTETINF